MAQILKFAHPNYTFDSEAAAVLVAAYDKAVFNLEDKGQPGTVREIIAKRIIELAAAGERDADTLCRVALASYGISR